MKIKLLRQIDYLFIFVFIAFTLDFGNIKYALAALFAVLYLLSGLSRGNALSFRYGGKAYLTVLCGLMVLFAITAVLQIVNGFQSYAVNEVIYFITPLFLVWVYSSAASKQTLEKMLNIMFYIGIMAFVADKAPYFSIENIKAISYTDSYSVFESGYAYYFLIFECLFLYKGEKKKAAASLILSILGFKRFCLIAAIVIFIFGNIFSEWFKSDKPISRKVVILMTGLFVLLPVITCVLVNEEFSEWFESAFGISLRKFTLTRSERIMMVTSSDEIKHGLGSTTVFMTKVFQQIHNSKVDQWNLHNDVVRIYVECGLLGSLAFTYSFFKATSFNRAMFAMMIYVFMECFFNHLFGAGTVVYWTTVYMVIAYVAAPKESASETMQRGYK